MSVINEYIVEEGGESDEIGVRFVFTNLYVRIKVANELH